MKAWKLFVLFRKDGLIRCGGPVYIEFRIAQKMPPSVSGA